MGNMKEVVVVQDHKIKFKKEIIMDKNKYFSSIMKVVNYKIIINNKYFFKFLNIKILKIDFLLNKYNN